MGEALKETIQRLIENVEKTLSDMELSLPFIMKIKQIVEEGVREEGNKNVYLDLYVWIIETMLAENEIIYDISASLNALLKANDDYTKRYYMQNLNLCFCESSQLFVGQDEDGLLIRVKKLTKELKLDGCCLLVKHIIDDVQKLSKEFADRELRNITRHYDCPVKMCDKLHELNNIDYYAKGACSLMAICMELMVVSSHLLKSYTPTRIEYKNEATCPQNDLKKIINESFLKEFKKKEIEDGIKNVLDSAQQTIDRCRDQYEKVCRASCYLKENKCQVPEAFSEMKTLVELRMETLFLRYDVACMVWGYLNAVSDMDRSQKLRMIHVTKQAALTHIYGYNDKAKKISLWKKIKEMEEKINMKLETVAIEKLLNELTGKQNEACSNSNVFAHYRHKQKYYIADRIDSLGKMQHHQEVGETLKLFKLCKMLDDYTNKMLCCLCEKQSQEIQIQHNEWNCKIDRLISQTGNVERVKDVLEPMRKLIDEVYGNRAES